MYHVVSCLTPKTTSRLFSFAHTVAATTFESDQDPRLICKFAKSVFAEEFIVSEERRLSNDSQLIPGIARRPKRW